MIEIEYQLRAIEQQRRAEVRQLNVARLARRLNPIERKRAQQDAVADAPHVTELIRAPGTFSGREA